MLLVDEAHRDRTRPARALNAARVHVVDVRELDLGLAALVRRDDGVLVLDLGVQDEVSVELVAQVDDRARRSVIWSSAPDGSPLWFFLAKFW